MTATTSYAARLNMRLQFVRNAFCQGMMRAYTACTASASNRQQKTDIKKHSNHMSNLEIFVYGMIATLLFSMGMLMHLLGYDEAKNKKIIEIDTDLGATKKYR